MIIKQDKRELAASLIDTAMRKRTFAQLMLDEAEKDLAKAKAIMEDEPDAEAFTD